jgi:hypothetical protein
MANIKFSEFTAETAIAVGLFVVGYDGSTNKRILATDLLGNYLPLAGGTMTGNTLHGDSVKSIYGDGTDLQIYHSTNSFITSGSSGGNLNIQNLQNSGDITFTATYNNSTKQFMRIDGGANRIIVSEDMNFNSGDKLILNDNLRIYSSGNDSFISELDATGILYIQAGADLKLQSSGNEDYIICNENTSVELYYNNIKKLETTSTGANIIDTLGISGDFTNPGLLKLYAPILANYVGIKGPLDAGTSYDLQLPNALPNVANQILESDASGTLSWIATPGGGGGATELNDLTDCSVDSSSTGGVSLVNVPAGGVGGRSTIIGKNAGNASTSSLIDATIIGNWAGYNQAGTFGATYIGSYAGYNQTSTSAFANIFVGEKAGYGAVGASGFGNVGIGKDTMLSITSGSRNMAMGYRSLRFLTTGSSNIAIGQDAGEGIIFQSNNVCIGQETLENSPSSGCVAIGHQALDTGASSTSYSIAIGYQAGRSFQVQQGLIAMGYQASKSHTSGADCVTIGRSAGVNNTTGQQRTIVGNNAAQYNTGNGNTAVGFWALKGASSGTVNGGFNVAIGRHALDVLTTGSFNTAIGNDSADSLQTGFFNTYLGRNSGTGHINGSNCTFVGNAAAPSTTGASNEIVLGDASISTLRCQVTSITALSDRRDKTKIEESNYGLNVIDKLKPVTFDWNTRDGAKVGIKDLGFIAQDLQEVDDENLKLVYDTNPEKLEASYGRLIPVLVKAIQELKAEIEILKS